MSNCVVNSPFSVKAFFLIFSMISSSIAGVPPVDLSALQERNELYFEVNQSAPFSGTAFEERYRNGQFKNLISIKDGLEVSRKLFYENGQIKGETKVRKNGYEAELYFLNGSTEVTEKLSIDNEGRELKERVRFYPNGQVRFESKWVEGLPVQTWKWYSDQGEVLRSQSFNIDSGRIQVPDVEMNIIDEFEVVSGKIDGIRTRYRKTGAKLLTQEYSHGLRNGAYYYYGFFTDKHPQEKGVYKDGIKHGEWYQWDDSKKALVYVGHYKNDLRQGFWKEYLLGDLRSIGEYKDDLKEGDWFYFNNKKPYYKKEFFNDILIKEAPRISPEDTKTIDKILSSFSSKERSSTRDVLKKEAPLKSEVKEKPVIRKITVEELVNREILANWKPPAGLKQYDDVTAKVVVGKSGKIISYELLNSSGSRIYDRSIDKAIISIDTFKNIHSLSESDWSKVKELEVVFKSRY